jgi:tRNA threonylcarbamoyladenosine biosynthesis protein TsaE
VLKAILPDEQSTLALGAALAHGLERGMVVYLHGELGAGKTTLVRGVLRAAGFAGRVKSPTYTLVEVYEVSRLNFHHFDFYRFQDPREWIDAGFRETFDGTNVSLVEWPEKAQGLLPAPDVDVTLQIQDAGRVATLVANTPAGQRCIDSARLHFELPSGTSP